MSSYPHLFAPIRVRDVFIKNRIESSPMSASGDVPFFTREAYEMYDSFARGGAGIVTLGEAGVHTLTDHAHPTMPHLDDTRVLPRLIQTVDTIHKWGALASIELTHSGSRASSAYLPPHGYVIGPSPMEANLYGDPVLEMDEEMMHTIADAYAQAAYLAQFAGVDIVNIHGGHGWLINQFLSDLNNHRKDKYGGSLENKARFPLMIVDRIRERCGKDLIIEFRLSSVEETPGGMEIDEIVEFSRMLDGRVDIIHVSAGTFHDTKTSARMMPTVFYPRGINVDNAAKIKAAVKESLVSVVGALSDPAFMDEVLAQNKADIVVVGRQFIADPNWPKKAREGRADEISSCIRCQTCISAGFIPHVPFSSGVLRCSVNPKFGREYENTRREEVIEKVKKVLIAGGGPAGIQAALSAADRGHRVILCERENQLAGGLDYAKHIDFKQDIVDYLDSQLTKLNRNPNIQIRLNTTVDEELIKKEAPDVLIVACGAQPFVPSIPGIDLDHVHLVTQIHRDQVEVGEKVVIIGGGLAGCEEGLNLAWQGKDVTVVEMLDGLAQDAPYIHWLHLMTKVEESLSTYLSSTVKAIEPQGVLIRDKDGEEKLLEADTVIIATGSKGNSQRFDGWLDLAEEVKVIGDTRKASKILEAVRWGYCAGITL